MHRSLTAAFEKRGLNDVEWHYEDVQTTDFDGYDFAPYDLIIVGGGGLLWDKPELKSYTGWQWQIPAEQLLKIEAPLVLYGLGWTRFPYHDPTGSEIMWSHLRIAASKAALVSVRNAETRNLLKQHGIPKTSHIPDPAIDIDSEPLSPIIKGKRIIGLCWASDKPEMRFGNQVRYDHWLESYAMYLNKITTDDDAVLMVEHIAGLDTEAREVFKAHLGDRFTSAEEIGMLEAFSEDDGTPKTENVPLFFSMYDHCAAVFSSRKHGIWIPAGKRIPALGFGLLNEVGWTLKSVGMGPFDISPVDLEVWPGIVGAALEHATDAGPAAYERSLPPLRRAVARFNGRVAALL